MEEGTESVLPSLELNVIIVGANPRLSKVFYLKQWTPDQEPTNPDCYSLDGIAPDAASPAPQHTRCVDCPQNAWGSRTTPTGTSVKACADQKRLAVVSADDVSGPIYLIQVPPASLRNLNTYHKELSRRGIPPEVVSSLISFDTDASHPKLSFRFGGFITEADQKIVDALFTAENVLEITGEKITPLVDTLPSVKAPIPQPVVQKVATPKPTIPTKPVIEQTPVPIPAKRGFGAAPKVVPPVNVVTNELGNLEAEVAALISGDSDDAK